MKACKYMRWANFSGSFLGKFPPVFQQILHFVAHTPRSNRNWIVYSANNFKKRKLFIMIHLLEFEADVFLIIFTAWHSFFEFIFCSFVFCFINISHRAIKIQSLHFLIVRQKWFRRNGIHGTNGADANDLWGGKCPLRLIDSRNWFVGAAQKYKTRM